MAARGRGQPGHVPRLERPVPRLCPGCAPVDERAKINRFNSKIKVFESPENYFDIDIFINPKESVDIADIQCILVASIFWEQKC